VCGALDAGHALPAGDIEVTRPLQMAGVTMVILAGPCPGSSAISRRVLAGREGSREQRLIEGGQDRVTARESVTS